MNKNTFEDGTLIIQNENLKNAAKVRTIKEDLVISSRSASLALNNHTLTINGFSSVKSAQIVESQVMEILNDPCENLNVLGGALCRSIYNCCDCGGDDCGCPYCFSCHACYHCSGEDDDDEQE